MAGEFGSDPTDTLRSFWGTFQRAAAEKYSTAEVWQSLRDAAYNSAQAILNVTAGGAASESEIAGKAADLLSGISASDVSAMRGQAGAWLRAREALHGLSPTEQVEGRAIFQAAWSTSGDVPALPPQYRVRVQFDVVNRMFPSVALEPQWASYTLVGEPSTIADAIDFARRSYRNQYGNAGYVAGEALDYEIETV